MKYLQFIVFVFFSQISYSSSPSLELTNKSINKAEVNKFTILADKVESKLIELEIEFEATKDSKPKDRFEFVKKIFKIISNNKT